MSKALGYHRSGREVVGLEEKDFLRMVPECHAVAQSPDASQTKTQSVASPLGLAAVAGI